MSKTSIFDLYETNQDAEENGKWFEEFGPEIRIKIRRFTALKSRKVREGLFKPYLKQYKTLDKIPEVTAEELTAQHLAEGVITDWSGVYDKKGDEVPFSPSMAFTLMKALPDLAKEILLLSINMDNYRTERKDEIKGN